MIPHDNSWISTIEIAMLIQMDIIDHKSLTECRHFMNLFLEI